MAQLPCIGLSWPLTKPAFRSCAIYFHYGVSGFNPSEKYVVKLNYVKLDHFPNFRDEDLNKMKPAPSFLGHQVPAGKLR